MEGNIRDADFHLTETTPIVHRTTGNDEVLFGIEGHNYWQTQATRERFMAKLIDQWVENGWSEDIESCYLESRVKRGLVKAPGQVAS